MQKGYSSKRVLAGERVILGEGLSYTFTIWTLLCSLLVVFPNPNFSFLEGVQAAAACQTVSAKGHSLYLVGGPKPPQSLVISIPTINFIIPTINFIILTIKIISSISKNCSFGIVM